MSSEVLESCLTSSELIGYPNRHRREKSAASQNRLIADIPRHSFERLLDLLQPRSKLYQLSILPNFRGLKTMTATLTQNVSQEPGSAFKRPIAALDAGNRTTQ
jgi:hypothetical protein